MPADATQDRLFVHLSAYVPARRSTFGLGYYLQLQNFYQLQFRADEYKIPALQKAPAVICNCYEHSQHF